MIEIQQIQFSKFLDPMEVEDKTTLVNIRKTSLLSYLDELKISIKTIGVQEPLVCRLLPTGKYEILNGQRRYLAVKQLVEEFVVERDPLLPAIVKDVSDDEARLLSAIYELLHLAASNEDKGEQLKKLMVAYKDMKDRVGLDEDKIDWLMSTTSVNRPDIKGDVDYSERNKEFEKTRSIQYKPLTTMIEDTFKEPEHHFREVTCPHCKQKFQLEI